MGEAEVDRALIEAAEGALRNAYAPYSGLRVAAAVRDEDGRVFVGVNVENVSYGLTQCAERVAVANAVAHGAKRLSALAVTSTLDGVITPCGACRQVLAEFANAGSPVFLADKAGTTVQTTVGELLPRGFLSLKSSAA